MLLPTLARRIFNDVHENWYCGAVVSAVLSTATATPNSSRLLTPSRPYTNSHQLFTRLNTAVVYTIPAGEDLYYEIRLLTCGTERGTTADRLIPRKPELQPQSLVPAISIGTKVSVMSETGNELARIIQQLPDEAGTPCPPTVKLPVPHFVWG